MQRSANLLVTNKLEELISLSVYVLYVKPGCDEIAHKELLLKGYNSMCLREDILERHGGEWKSIEKLLMPSYIFVDVEYTAEVFYAFKNIHSIVKILGKPTPLSDDEAEYIFRINNRGKPIKPLPANSEEELLRMLPKGSKVIKFNKRQKRAKVSVMIAGINHTFTISLDI